LTSSHDDNDLILRLTAAAYWGRYTGISRLHTESDLRLFFAWCTKQNLAPLAAPRAQIDRYVRRMTVVTGFYRTCVIDAALAHSPTDYMRRPLVPAESPTLGLSHLQFEASLTAARESPQRVRLRPGDDAGLVSCVLVQLRCKLMGRINLDNRKQ
jgi:hypothetical protein